MIDVPPPPPPPKDKERRRVYGQRQTFWVGGADRQSTQTRILIINHSLAVPSTSSSPPPPPLPLTISLPLKDRFFGRVHPPWAQQTWVRLISFTGDPFPGRVIPVAYKTRTPVATLPAAWCYCWEWFARCQYTVPEWDIKVKSAISISTWMHVQLSEQIRPRDTRACCWDVKQPTNDSNPPQGSAPPPLPPPHPRPEIRQRSSKGDALVCVMQQLRRFNLFCHSTAVATNMNDPMRHAGFRRVVIVSD